MKYIVIEWFDKDFPMIVTNEDGRPIIFDKVEDAEIEAENCQFGIVVVLTR